MSSKTPVRPVGPQRRPMIKGNAPVKQEHPPAPQNDTYPTRKVTPTKDRPGNPG